MPRPNAENAIHLNADQLQAGLEKILLSPKDNGILELVVRRPEIEQRETLDRAELNTVEGLIGDNWLRRGASHTAHGSADPEMQLNIMNARAIALIATCKERWPLAGDQLYIDLDLSNNNLPAGTRLKVGSALIEVTGVPHLGCKKFVSRFGLAAMKFVNSKLGKQHNLRGINAKVVESGVINIGDTVSKI